MLVFQVVVAYVLLQFFGLAMGKGFVYGGLVREDCKAIEMSNLPWCPSKTQAYYDHGVYIDFL
jgi:hypothetical protein